MTQPVDVQIVQTKPTFRGFLSILYQDVTLALLRGYVVMLLLGSLTTWHPSFWTTVFVVYGVRMLTSGDTTYRLWTKEA